MWIKKIDLKIVWNSLSIMIPMVSNEVLSYIYLKRIFEEYFWDTLSERNYHGNYDDDSSKD